MPQRMLSGKTNSHAQVLKRRAQHAFIVRTCCQVLFKSACTDKVDA